MMVGAYSMYALRALPFIVALLLTVVFGFFLGLALERGILRWVYDKGFMATLLASWGVGTVLEQGVAAIFTVSQRGVNSPLTGKLTIGDFSYPVYRVVVAAGIIALLAILLLLVYRTTLGLRLRASIDNVEMASVLGISPQRMFAMVFSVATALAVLAGALIAPTIAINPTLGLSFLAPAFFAVLVAKPGSLAGPVLGAMAVQAVLHLVAGRAQCHGRGKRAVRPPGAFHRSQTPGHLVDLENSKEGNVMMDKIEDLKAPSPSLSRRSVVQGGGRLAPGLAGGSMLAGLTTTTARADFMGSRPFKIGFVAPLTGPVAPEGLSMQRGFDLGLEHLNAAGGIAGQKVEAVTQDTKADPAVVTTVVKKFIQEEKVDMILGTITNDEEDAAARVGAAAHTPVMFIEAGYWHAFCNTTAVLMGENSFDLCAPLVPFMAEKFGKKFLLIGSDFSFPHAYLGVAKKYIAQVGGSVVDELARAPRHARLVEFDRQDQGSQA